MSYRDGISRDIAAKRQRDRAAADEQRAMRICDMTGLVRNGQISPRKFLEITQQIIDGDADRIVRVGEEYRPDIQTGETR
jgi:hypothetical protein